MSHERNWERYPASLAKWHIQIRVFFICVGIILACLAVATWMGVWDA